LELQLKQSKEGLIEEEELALSELEAKLSRTINQYILAKQVRKLVETFILPQKEVFEGKTNPLFASIL